MGQLKRYLPGLCVGLGGFPQQSILVLSKSLVMRQSLSMSDH